jgi:hypothetical protein
MNVQDRNGLAGGNTNFTRSFAPNQGYGLTAPASHAAGGNTYVFDRWLINGGGQAPGLLPVFRLALLVVEQLGSSLGHTLCVEG